jgi:hypothetical protein
MVHTGLKRKVGFTLEFRFTLVATRWPAVSLLREYIKNGKMSAEWWVRWSGLAHKKSGIALPRDPAGERDSFFSKRKSYFCQSHPAKASRDLRQF